MDVTTFTRAELLDLISSSLAGRIRLDVAWLNPYYVQVASRSAELRDLLNRYDVLQPDGWGVVAAARLAKIPVEERLAIEDIERDVFGRMAGLRQRVYLFGAEPGMAEQAAATLATTFPGLEIAGTDHGWYDALAGHPGRYRDDDNDRIVARINEANADLLLVSLPTPFQQQWTMGNRDRLDVPATMLVGAYFDHLAEGVDWYPRWMDRLRLGWLYRLAREPRRLLYRYTIGMAHFGWLVLREVYAARWPRRRSG